MCAEQHPILCFLSLSVQSFPCLCQTMVPLWIRCYPLSPHSSKTLCTFDRLQKWEESTHLPCERSICFSLITWYADNVELCIAQNPDQFVVLPSHHQSDKLQNEKRISWILWNIKVSIHLHWTIQKHLKDDEFLELFGMMESAAQFERQLWQIIHIVADGEAYNVKRPNHFLCLTMEIVQWVVFDNPAGVTGWDWDLSELKEMFHLSEQQALTSKHILFSLPFGSTFMVEISLLLA